jgi:uncharacterized membrane protein YgcG
MTTAADDFAVEEAFEAFLVGRPVPEQGASVAAFAEAVRGSASAPGRPNAALAALLANGLLTDQPSPSPRTAPRRRRRVAMAVPALLARIASAGAVAQAATGAGIVLVAFAGAGAAGALPDSLQHGFATVASTVGIQVEDPRPADDAVVPTVPATTPPPPTATEAPAPVAGTDGGGDAQAPVTDDGLTREEWEKGPADGQSFGDWVSEGARHGYADGAIISREAHEKGIVLPEDAADASAGTADRSGHSTAPSRTNRDHRTGNSSSDHGSSGGHGSGGRSSSGHSSSGHGNGSSGGSGGDDGDR